MDISFADFHKNFSRISSPSVRETLNYMSVCAEKFLQYYSYYYQAESESPLAAAVDSYTHYFEADNKNAIFINVAKLLSSNVLNIREIRSGTETHILPIVICDIQDELDFIACYSLSYNDFVVLLSQLQCWTLEAYSKLTYKNIIQLVSSDVNQKNLYKHIDDVLKNYVSNSSTGDNSDSLREAENNYHDVRICYDSSTQKTNIPINVMSNPSVTQMKQFESERVKVKAVKVKPDSKPASLPQSGPQHVPKPEPPAQPQDTRSELQKDIDARLNAYSAQNGQSDDTAKGFARVCLILLLFLVLLAIFGSGSPEPSQSELNDDYFITTPSAHHIQKTK